MFLDDSPNGYIQIARRDPRLDQTSGFPEDSSSDGSGPTHFGDLCSRLSICASHRQYR